MKTFSTNNGLKPIGPYSQATQAGNMVFLSGVVGINPDSGAILMGDIKAETKQAMENIKSILAAAELNFEHVVKTSIFLVNMNDFASVNEVYGSYFTGNYPARETVQVSRLPLNANIEISVIAVIE